MATFEVIEAKRDMVKVRYKGIGTTGYRYRDAGTPGVTNKNTQPVPEDKSGPAAWAAQFRQADFEEQERDEQGNFVDGDLDPVDEGDGGVRQEPPTRTFPERVREQPFVERVYQPTEEINTNTEDVERQQRYAGVTYDTYTTAEDELKVRLDEQTREIIDQYSGTIGFMWTIRYAVIDNDEILVDRDHENKTYTTEEQGIQTEFDMSIRKTKMSNYPDEVTLEVMLGDVPNNQSLPAEFSNVLEEIFQAVQGGSGDEIVVFQTVVEGWRYD